MKKQTLIPALAIVAVATTLSLPVTASADSIKHKETMVVHGDYSRDAYVRPVHNVDRRYIDTRKYGHPRHHHHRSHHYGNRHKHTYRHDYRPVERSEHRSDYRPLERYNSRPDGDVRVRISYDLHL